MVTAFLPSSLRIEQVHCVLFSLMALAFSVRPASPAYWPASCQLFALSLLVISQFFFQLASDCTLFSLHALSHLIFHLFTLQRLLYPHCLRLYLAVNLGRGISPPYYHDHDLVSKAECSAVAFTIDLFKAHMWINTEYLHLKKVGGLSLFLVLSSQL